MRCSDLIIILLFARKQVRNHSGVQTPHHAHFGCTRAHTRLPFLPARDGVLRSSNKHEICIINFNLVYFRLYISRAYPEELERSARSDE